MTRQQLVPGRAAQVNPCAQAMTLEDCQKARRGKHAQRNRQGRQAGRQPGRQASVAGWLHMTSQQRCAVKEGAQLSSLVTTAAGCWDAARLITPLVWLC